MKCKKKEERKIKKPNTSNNDITMCNAHDPKGDEETQEALKAIATIKPLTRIPTIQPLRTIPTVKPTTTMSTIRPPSIEPSSNIKVDTNKITLKPEAKNL